MLVFTYLRFATRSILRNKLFSVINVLSLSIGLAFGAMAIALITVTNSFDKFHEDFDKIYRLQSGMKSFTISNTPAPLGPAMSETLPQVSSFLRMTDKEAVLHLSDNASRERLLFVDPDFFSFFNFGLKTGSPINAFPTEKSAVITPSIAKKYFGHDQVIGSVIPMTIDGQDVLFTVSAIAEEPPFNSSIGFGIVVPLANNYLGKREDILSNWDSYSMTTLVKIESQELQPVETGLSSLIVTHMGESLRSEGSGPSDYKFTLHALADYHSQGTHASAMIAPRDPRMVKVFGMISAFILLVAFFNFCNLSASQNLRRITETGIRRVMGAKPFQLVGQFLSEGLLISVISLAGAMLLIALCTGISEQALGIRVPLLALSGWAWAGIALITFTSGLLIGLVSAFIPGKVPVVAALRKTYRLSHRNWLTRSGLAIQFSIAIVLLGCALVIGRQQQFVGKFDKGYNGDNVMVLHTGGLLNQQVFATLKNDLLATPGVEKVSAVSNSFSRGNSASIVQREGEGMIAVFDYRADEDYASLLDLDIEVGRFPKPGTKEIVVNQEFLKVFSLEQPVGTVLDDTFGSLKEREIVGIVRNYNFQSLLEKMHPMALRALSDKDSFRSILVRYSGPSLSSLVNDVGATWRRTVPAGPFDFSFLNDDVMKDYEAEERWNQITKWSAILAVAIALLGVFGLTSLQLTRRIREIGIRKVLGATDLSIMRLMQRQYVWIIIVAQAVSLPLTWWIAGEWMNNFVYKTEVPWYLFVTGGLVALSVTLLLSGVQVVQVAGRNSAEVLRSE